jgi:hypothetical protein
MRCWPQRNSPAKTANDEPVVAEDPQWSTFVDEDIANMLTQAGVSVDGRWGRKTLIEKAESIIAAKKKAA